MSNKQGFILGFSSAIIYTLILFDFNSYYYISGFFAYLIGALIVPSLIAGIISIFSKGKNFGKTFGMTCVIFYLIIGIGSSVI
jgi:uncharacterized membrane protein HdeD (DUF308 family)